MTFDDAQHVFAPVRKGNSKGNGTMSYESTPVCAKPSYWMRRDDGGEFIHEFTWKWTAYIE